MSNTFVQRPGSTWVFDSTLTDTEGNAITSLLDAWISVYSDEETELLAARLADPTVTLSSNVLTTEFPANETTSIPPGTYYLSIQIQQADNTVTEFEPDRIKVTKRSTLYDDY